MSPLLSHLARRMMVLAGLLAPPVAVLASAGLPLNSARTIQFDTDEGTWMSLDASPQDGRIVFDLLGDLYEISAQGGAASAIRTGFPFDSQPRFSPDGAQIAFVSDASGRDGVWIMRADGTAPELLYESGEMGQATVATPAWSPDGKTIAFWTSVELDGDESEYRVPSLWTIDLRTRKVEVLRDREGQIIRGMSPVFGPDGRTLYFSEVLAGESWNPGTDVQLPLYQVTRYDLRDSVRQRITSLHEGGFRPAISPDNRWMIYGSRYWSRSGLRIRDLHSGVERWLAFPVDRDAVETFADLDLLPAVTFSADSRYAYSAFGGKIRRIELASGAASIIPFQAHVDIPLGPLLRFPHPVDDSPSVKARQIQTPRLSPDGKRVAFGAFGEIWTMNIADRRVMRIAGSGEGVRYHPAWTPDGRALVYCSWDATKGGHLWETDIEGSGASRKLSAEAESGFWLHPLVTDGGRIVASYAAQADRLREVGVNVWDGRSENYQLRILDGKSGGASSLITQTLGPVSAQRMADPDTVVFYEGASRKFADRGAQAQLISVNLSGSNRQRVLRIAGPRPPGTLTRTPVDIVLSPDRRRAIVRITTTSYLLPIGDAKATRTEWSLSDAMSSAIELPNKGLDFIEWSRDGQRLIAAAADSLYWGEAPANPSSESIIPLQRIRPALELPRAHPTGTLLLTGARLLTMRGQEIIESGDVLIKGNRIQAIGPTGTLRVPRGTRSIDLSGRTLAPGLFDSHSHTALLSEGVPTNPDWILAASLAYGVTTLFDPDPVNANHCCTSWTLPYSELIETGRITGPRLFTTGQGYRWDERVGRDSDAAEAVKLRRDVYGLDWAKYYLAGSRNHRQQFAIQAFQSRVSPTLEGMGVMRKDLTYIQDGFAGHEHTIPYAPMYRDVREFIARSQSWITSTLMVIRGEGGPSARWYYLDKADPSDDERFNRFLPPADVRRAVARREWAFNDKEQAFSEYAKAAGSVIAAGGLMTVGGHGEITGLQLHWEIWSLATGMPPYDALRAATILPAKAHGLDRDLGSLEPGKLADFVVFAKNPLDDIRNTLSVSHVVTNGVVYDATSMDQLYPEHRPFGTPWWAGLDVPKPQTP